MTKKDVESSLMSWDIRLQGMLPLLADLSLFNILIDILHSGLQGAVGNAGQQGVIAWMVQHTCHLMCKNMGLKSPSTSKASMVDYSSSGEDEPSDD